MKIYRVVLKSKYLPAGEDEVEITTFLNKELAEQYIKDEKKNFWVMTLTKRSKEKIIMKDT